MTEFLKTCKVKASWKPRNLRSLYPMWHDSVMECWLEWPRISNLSALRLINLIWIDWQVCRSDHIEIPRIPRVSTRRILARACSSKSICLETNFEQFTFEREHKRKWYGIVKVPHHKRSWRHAHAKEWPLKSRTTLWFSNKCLQTSGDVAVDSKNANLFETRQWKWCEFRARSSIFVWPHPLRKRGTVHPSL